MWTGILAVALSVAFTASACAQNLIANGGFENPKAPTRGYTTYPAGSRIGAWIVFGAGNVATLNGQYTHTGHRFPAHRGQQSLDLTGLTNNATGVVQRFATEPRRFYILRFSVGNVYDPDGIFGKTSKVEVRVDNERVLVVTNTQRSSKLAWTRYTYTFDTFDPGHRGFSTVAFINRDPATDYNNGLDSVEVVERP